MAIGCIRSGAYRYTTSHLLLLCLRVVVARLWFSGKAPLTLSALQKAILVGVGFQHKTIDELAKELQGIAVSQIMALFSQLVRKLSKVG